MSEHSLQAKIDSKGESFDIFCDTFFPEDQMCKSPVDISPQTHVLTGQNNSSVTANDLTHSIYAAINVNITTSVIFLFLSALIILTVFIFHQINKSHIFDLHERIQRISNKEDPEAEEEV